MSKNTKLGRKWTIGMTLNAKDHCSRMRLWRKWELWKSIKNGQCLVEGDKNTGFFHRMANSHRRRNTISNMRIDGKHITGEEDLRIGIAKAFEALLSDSGDWRASPMGLDLSKLMLLKLKVWGRHS